MYSCSLYVEGETKVAGGDSDLGEAAAVAWNAAIGCAACLDIASWGFGSSLFLVI